MIYADNNATTPLDSAVRAAMLPFLAEAFANPSSPYTAARVAASALQRAREQVAGLVGAQPAEITFTGGGTESNGLALVGALAGRGDGRRRVVISAVEHACVWETAQALAGRGYGVEVIPVSAEGALDEERARALIGADTALVSVMLANNETGVIHPVARLAGWARGVGAWVHTDAVQAVGKIPVGVGELGVDLLSCCAHKLGGPKGVGALYVRDGVRIDPPWRGGDQEWGRRAGTENVAGIVGFGVAAELAQRRLEGAGWTADLRDAFEMRLRAEVSGIEILGATQPRLPNTSQFLVEGVESEALIARMDLLDICVSSGSACASGAAEPSRVVRAMGRARAGWGILRVSLGADAEPAHVDSLVAALRLSVERLRMARF
jgi:cysteine desulfurase